jgi:hypothetical protein
MASVGGGLPSHKSTIVKQLMSNGIKAIFEAIQKLLTPPDEKKEYKIGFGRF